MQYIKKIENDFGGIDEKAMTKQIEAICGVDKCFRLMRIYERSQSNAKAHGGYGMKTPPPMPQNFYERANCEGDFTTKQLVAFAEFRSVV